MRPRHPIAPATPPDPAALDLGLLALTASCVKCGLCLPHCPTYALTQDEGESPRGRIALVQGWVGGALPTSPSLAAHLDRCLGCRACETACPSRVPFGRLLDAARARQALTRPRWRRLARRLRLAALRDARRLRALARLATLYRASGLARVAARLEATRWPRVHALHRLALVLAARTPQAEAASDAPSPDLYLFGGCVTATALPAAVPATLRVLGTLGYRAALTAGTGCCGALHRHQGDPTAADRELARLVASVADVPVMGLASACVAELRERAPMTRSAELCAWLAEQPWPDSVRLAPLAQEVLIHTPCSHRHWLGGHRDVRRLLARIPGIRVSDLPDDGLCCGAAGTYMLDQPRLSQALLRAKLDQLRACEGAILVTTSPGCALHLAAGIREANLAIELCHPIELIARQLR